MDLGEKGKTALMLTIEVLSNSCDINKKDCTKCDLQENDLCLNLKKIVEKLREEEG
jgi:hypothetical protein